MGEKYGCEVAPNGDVTVRSPKNVVLHSESATGKVSVIIGSTVAQSFDGASGVSGQKSHTGFTGSDFFTKTAAVQTTGAAVTTLATIPVPLSTTVAVWAKVVGKKEGASADGFVSYKYNAATNAAGSTTLLGVTGGTDIESSAGAPTVTITANDPGDAIVVQVTGIAAETWAWVGLIEYMQVTSSA